MKKLISFIVILFPLISLAQIEVTLNVNQPPEFGFQISSQEITIVSGASVTLGSDIIVLGGSGEYNYHWSPTATLNDSTVLNPVATPSDTTVYVLTVFDNNGCSFSIDYTVNVKEAVVGVLDVDNEESDLYLILYPNPNDGIFKVQFKGLACENIEFLIIDNSGRKVYNKKILNFTGELTETFKLNLNPGAYFISVYSDNEKLTRQFIIH